MEYFTSNEEKSIYINTQPHIEALSYYFNKFFAAYGTERLYECKEVWIKPNITGIEIPERGKTSQPLVLEALIDTIMKFRQACDIYVADSSVIGCNTIEAAKKSGIYDVCNKKGVTFVDLRNLRYQNVDIKNHFGIKELNISYPFLTNDIFKINLAKLKSVYGSPIGFTIKNSKGIISDDDKLSFHENSLQNCLCDLALNVNWDISILEGFPISELGVPGGVGPFGISDSSILLDCIMCYVVGIDFKNVGHINQLSKTIKSINELLESNDLKILRSTCKPLMYSKNWLEDISKENNVEIVNGNPCSACLESFAKTTSIFNSQAKNISIIIGSSFKETNCSKRSICIGNCAISTYGASDFTAIGCPPTIDSMKEVITKAMSMVD